MRAFAQAPPENPRQVPDRYGVVEFRADAAPQWTAPSLSPSPRHRNLRGVVASSRGNRDISAPDLHEPMRVVYESEPRDCMGTARSVGQASSSTLDTARYNSPRVRQPGSPPRPTSPRMRMTDLLSAERGPIRPPSRGGGPGSPVFGRSSRSAERSSADHTARRSARPRVGSPGHSPTRSPNSLRASDEAFVWLKVAQTDSHAESEVDKMLGEVDSPQRTLEFRFAREQLRNPSYRNATKCATSLARRSKPPK